MGFPTFAEFHQAVYGSKPFPWQQTLARQIIDEGWPDTIDVPTGLGKTRTIVVALWRLAWQMAHEQKPRTAPLRILHVVDRTTIVDQTHHDLLTLRDALCDPDSEPVRHVAATLRAAFGEPLVISKIHGAAPDDGGWVAVDKPTVVTMTAHQAVSRALFRGFGVSPGMAPVHAALLGVDSLILFDEPHLSAAAVKTLRAVKGHQGTHEIGVPTGKVVQMGATVSSIDGGTVHGISDADRDHPVAGARLTAAKTLRLHPCSKQDRVTIDAIIKVASQALSDTDEPVAVVANTVRAAREVYAALTTGKNAAVSADDALLVTSRIRKYERGALDASLSETELPRLLVGTQAVEAGMDFSASVLVTEICDWQALVQRLGRLNRFGALPSATAHVVVPAEPRPGTVAVYGVEPATALAELVTNLGDGADVSPRAITKIVSQREVDVRAATRRPSPAPTVTRELLPTIAHSRPVPAADLLVQRYITGVPSTARITDVTVLWRRGREGEFTLDLDGDRRMPPLPEETVTVPLAAVNALIASRVNKRAPAKLDIADDGESAPETAQSRWSVEETSPPPVLIRDGDRWVGAYSHASIRPGATVMLRSDMGGHDKRTGFDPESTNPVTDLFAQLAWNSGRWWHADADSLPTLGVNLDGVELDEFANLRDLDPDDVEAVVDYLLPADLKDMQRGRVTDTGLWLRTPNEERDQHRVPLADHAAHVATETETAALRVGLNDEVTTLLAEAGYHHDDGKSDAAFQAALGAGPDDPPLAKLAPEATFRSDLIHRGWRHESASLARNQGAHPLVRHIIAAHHGWARPLLPASEGPDQALPTADTFHDLNQIYGVWGLAWLETVMRLADHRASDHPTSVPPPDRLTAPTPAPIEEPDERRSVGLAGVPVDSALAWWATAGALAAATDLDPHAAITYTPSVVGPIATLHTTAPLKAIAAQVVATRNELDGHSKTLARKNEKVPAQWVCDTLAELDATGPPRELLASLLDDTAIADNGKVPLRTIWMHCNSTLLGAVIKAEHTAEQIADVLTRDAVEQRDGGHHFGMTPQAGATMILSGTVEKNTRSPLHLLLLAATARLPATGGPRPIGVTSNGRLHLALPKQATSWVELVALLQTLPHTAEKPWAHAGIDQAVYQRTRLDHAESFAWEPTEETP